MDSLCGNDGNDTLIGGSGDDTLSGGAGSDVFVFDTATTGAQDLITGRGPGVGHPYQGRAA